MLEKIIQYSVKNKLIVLLFSAGIVGFGLYSLSEIPIGAVPDVTNNQVQVITTSRNLATEDIERFITYPIELEMANLPNVQEIRSISKFGLSVVTVVFDDDMGNYLPRQLIAEKIKSAEEKIPQGFGAPFMGPISTGLGEIYQYTIEVAPEYRNQYSLTEIRTIQDWLVKRQLSGIPGVVEVNTWGGYLKQYEVAIKPEKLKSLNIPLSRVYEVLHNNNSVAGGGYIEKTNQSYFIRGEGLVSSFEDIENIVVEQRNGIPIYVKDIASVNFGHATRFGAITGNGEGEKVLGQVMMLKGANSKEVIEAVKDRVASISPSLPPGISINPFLERSELIGKTTFTIAENLILGCLIVIFVVVLLLGNLRSGLVVASVIPMSLLFALSLMYLFGVDANLMSLGAIDFGIIIDGAVIIVEFIAFKINAEREKIIGLPPSERRNYIDQLSITGANKMMHSAVFGQLIIIIVFIPILSLVGVEGKMFRPMALVFSFALTGTMLLGFTYVPVMASLFIKPSKESRRNISSRLISFISKKYQPIIKWALNNKPAVLGAALLLLASAGFTFSRMGGEFVPTLDEGDFVIQPVLKTGTSLSNTVLTTTRIEKILKDFPEVDQVVSRIGAAEVPTDPMSMEESDVIIKLKPKGSWTSANSKDELADKFKLALTEDIPGVDFEFTQPIEMRFNELITGVRADLAIKVFGEDLDLLYKTALDIEKAIENIEGAADISVDKVVGLPQMTVKYNRAKVAKYGMNIEELNQLISIGFAGMGAGTVFEGEKQFDLVIRFDQTNKPDISDLEKTSVQLPNGNQVPLSEFASITYTKGPAKIARDNTKRRIVVGVNVRNRDLESVVEDVQNAISADIELPSGYTIEYGGQFENLRTAKNRLMIAVPIALLLIFILLYFAFNSAKQALIIYSAIPLSAVGGIFLLYLRDLPFSISAGVGFIALFGIAVLNGIVLIEEFKELKTKGIEDINERILIGTQNRLRPVLLTAAAAALGFLPMAISTSAGAEVQRPLATVVVGGLISATLLTLLVLPVLYALFEDKSKPSKMKISKTLLPVIFVITIPAIGSSQNLVIGPETALQLALDNNLGLKASELRVLQSEQEEKGAISIDKTEVYYGKDNNNIAPNNLPLDVWGVRQSFQLSNIINQKRVLEAKTALVKDQHELDKQALKKAVMQSYYTMVYWIEMKQHYARLDSLYQQLASSSEKRFNQGESNYLEKLNAEAKSKAVGLKLTQMNENISKAHAQLRQWIQVGENFSLKDDHMERIPMAYADSTSNLQLVYFDDAIELAEQEVRNQKQALLPDINAEVFNGSNQGEGTPNYAGFEFGLAIPLWFSHQRSQVKAAQTASTILNAERKNYKAILSRKEQAIQSDIRQLNKELEYYESEGQALADETAFHAEVAFKNGEISFLEYSRLIDQSMSVSFAHLQALFDYNMSVLELNFLQH
jgi:cobalt-zinc-cadmium resistance protein CzcA